MSEKFQDKYRIASARLSFWDYGRNAAYFITICTHDKQHYFGNIVDHEMNLSDIGEIANQCWISIPDHFSFVELGEFVVMPDHMHGIIIINKSNDGRNDNPGIADARMTIPGIADARMPIPGNADARMPIPGIADARMPIPGNAQTPNLGVSTPNLGMASDIPKNEINRKNQTANASKKWTPDTLGVIINQYKRACTIQIRKKHPGFCWHSRYYDIIIRDERSFQRISDYIRNNPKKWK